MIWNSRSTKCISQAHAQIGSIAASFSFTSIRSSARNGTKKWPKIMMIAPVNHHVPFRASRYQKVSSGMFAFQMMKYCPKS